MDKYRILCDLTLKKLKNNLMIVIAEKTYMLIIFLISFIVVIPPIFICWLSLLDRVLWRFWDCSGIFACQICVSTEFLG